MATRHFLSIADLSKDELRQVLKRARKLKAKWHTKMKPSRKLYGYTLAAIYEKPSLRTRVTFEVAMNQLGGHTINLGPADIQIGKRESVEDVARNLSRWVQLIAARTFAHSTITDLAEYGSVPVINALSDREHPCQALADLLTVQEHLGEVNGRKLAYVGDGNNVTNSLLLAGGLLGLSISVACPADYSPDPAIVEQAREFGEQSGAEITITQDLHHAVAGADVIYTDVWTSMGQETEREVRAPIFAPYQITADVMLATGKPKTIFMHCLPAHRGEEVAANVIDGPSSVVFDQAENRLHAEKAIALFLLNK